MKILETERLILRRLSSADLDEIYDLVYADPAVKSMWSGQTGTSDEIKATFAKNHLAPESEFGLRAVVRKQDDRLIGLMGFQRHAPGTGDDIYYLLSEDAPDRSVGLDPDFIEAELTYALGRAYWKFGYATEMGQAMLKHGFERLNIGRVIQGVLSHNANSVALMQRLGLRIEKGLRSEHVVGVLDRATYRRRVAQLAAMKTRVSILIAGLSTADSAENERSLAEIRRLLAKDREFSAANAVLLFELQAVVDPVHGSPHPAINQAYDLILDKVFNHWASARSMPEMVAWYDQQMDFIGLVMAKGNERDFLDWEATVHPILSNLQSNDPARIAEGIREVEFWTFYVYVGDGADTRLMLALKQLTERRDSLDDSLTEQARQLLMEILQANQRLIDLTDDTIKILVAWYHAQPDSQPFAG